MAVTQTPAPKRGELFLEIVHRRYDNRSTITTSNWPVEE